MPGVEDGDVGAAEDRGERPERRVAREVDVARQA